MPFRPISHTGVMAGRTIAVMAACAWQLCRRCSRGETAEIEQVIEQLLEREDWQANKSFLHKLRAILTGDRSPALTEDDEMQYSLVAELKLLLEQSS